MVCNDCGKPNPEGADFCMFCGKPLVSSERITKESRIKVSFSKAQMNTDFNGDRQTGFSGSNSEYSAQKGSGRLKGTLCTYSNAEDNTAPKSKKEEAFVAPNLKAAVGGIPTAQTSTFEHRDLNNTRFCKKCGRRLMNGCCPVCSATARGNTPKYSKKSVKLWGVVASVFAIILLAVVLSFGKQNQSNDEVYTNVGEMILSSTCDYVLCAGTDDEGDTYELVADQTESAAGFEITVGVIKNNSWIYPMSKDFPFLEEDNLFHVTASISAKEASSLKYPPTVIKSIYFVDTGAFLLDCYKPSSTGPWFWSHTYIIFNCHSLDSYTINCEESSLVHLRNEADFYEDGFITGDVISYGKIYTENGKLVMYTDLTGDVNNPIYDWCIFDMKSLKTEAISTNIEGIHPCSVLSEGLFFASDQCFYNTSGQKVIDLSSYDIDMSYGSRIYFQNGTCSFNAKNNLGTKFLITIDSSGNVLSETVTS